MYEQTRSEVYDANSGLPAPPLGPTQTSHQPPSDKFQENGPPKPTLDVHRLGAPIADFEEGNITAAETPTASERDPESETEKTPIYELPRERQPFAIPPSPVDPIGQKFPPVPETATVFGRKFADAKDAQEEEAKLSLLLQQESESFDMDLDEGAMFSEEIPPISKPQKKHPPRDPPPSFIPVGHGSEDPEFMQLRKQYEIQATSRPRSTTPVSMCALDDYISTMEEVGSVKPVPADSEQMKIKLPPDSMITAPHARHRRRGSMSWSDFYEAMQQQIPPQVSGGGRRSGRTSPDPPDIFEQNPDYHGKVPPAPVVHRRTSMEWEVFQDEMYPIDHHKPLPRPEPLYAASAPSQPSVTYMDELDKPTDPQEPRLPSPPSASVDDASSWQNPQNTAPEAEQNQPDQSLQRTSYQDSAYSYAIADDHSLADFSSSYQEPVPGSEPTTTGTGYVGQLWDDYPPPATNNNPSEQVVPDTEAPPSGYVGQLWDDYPPPAMDYVPSDAALPGSEAVEATGYVGQSWEGYPPPSTADYAAPAPAVPDWGKEDFPDEQSMYYPPEPVAEPPLVDTDIYYPPPAPLPPPPPPPVVSDDWNEQPYIAPSYEEQMRQKAEEEKKQKASEPPKNEEKEEDDGQTDAWKEFQKITEKVNLMVQKTQENLKEIETKTISKDLPSQPYEMKSPTPPPPENLMDMEEKQADSMSSSSSKEWKPISEVLNAEIKRQKELNKPKRPPPPRPGVAPKRPPPPARSAPAKAPVTGVPSWDDEDASSFYANVPSYESRVPATANIDNQPAGGANKAAPYLDQYQSSSVSDESASFPPPPPPPVIDTAVSYSSDQDLPPPPLPGELLEAADVQNQNFLNGQVSSGDALSSFLNEDDMANTKNLQSDIDDFLGVLSAPPVQSHDQKTTDLMEEEKPPSTDHWLNFESTGGLPPSESDFFSKLNDPLQKQVKSNIDDAFAAPKAVDPFAPLEEESLLMQQSYDPFDVKPVDEIVADAKKKADAQISAQQVQEDLDFFGGMGAGADQNGASTTPTTEDGTSEANRPMGFEDDFKPPDDEDEDDKTPSPLYDEDDSAPLTDFPPKFAGDGWELMLRHPLKKKLMGDRYWKPVYIRLEQNNILLFHTKKDQRPFQELPLQSTYCLSDVVLQQYDIYGKIHTVKLQYVLYKERVGLRPGQIPKLVEGQFTKLGLPLEHAAQSSQLLKFGSLNTAELQSFVHSVEDVLFHCVVRREVQPIYKQDEIQIHCYDEYCAYVDKDGIVTDQKARVRLFCLAFVSGNPLIEIGLNDRRRQGKEIVRRKDILPMYTDRWIRFEKLEFHNTVSEQAFDQDHVIKLHPPDGCFFEVMRFRVRPPRAKELPLTVRSIMKIAGSKIEIRIECMVVGFRSRKAHQVPCEDIQIRFPIPEAWIYLFREERHWGYGSVHAKIKRPGKVKNLKDRIMGVVQHTDNSIMEAAIGDAKYEHVYRAMVWRIPRLPEKHHGAYKTHLLRCRFELSSFDLMPDEFLPTCDVEFTMPMATVSHTVVRSMSLEMHEDPDRVEKFVRYLAKYQYPVEIDYVQCADLDVDAICDTTVVDPEKAMETVPAPHRPSIDINETKELHTGYRIDFSDAETGGGRYDRRDSSSDEDEKGGRRHPPLKIEIDMTGYGY